MAVERVVQVRCDVCEKRTSPQIPDERGEKDPAAGWLARQRAREEGWGLTREDNTHPFVDLCPECEDARKREARDISPRVGATVWVHYYAQWWPAEVLAVNRMSVRGRFVTRDGEKVRNMNPNERPIRLAGGWLEDVCRRILGRPYADVATEVERTGRVPDIPDADEEFEAGALKHTLDHAAGKDQRVARGPQHAREAGPIL